MVIVLQIVRMWESNFIVILSSHCGQGSGDSKIRGPISCSVWLRELWQTWFMMEKVTFGQIQTQTKLLYKMDVEHCASTLSIQDSLTTLMFIICMNSTRKFVTRCYEVNRILLYFMFIASQILIYQNVKFYKGIMSYTTSIHGKSLFRVAYLTSFTVLSHLATVTFSKQSSLFSFAVFSMQLV